MRDAMNPEEELARLRARADAALDRRDFDQASVIYGQLAAIRPDEFFYFARYIETSNKLDGAAPADLVFRRPGFPAGDDQFFWGCQVLIEARAYAAVRALIERETAAGQISPAYLAVGRARLLTSTGLRSRAVEALSPILMRDDAPPVALRIGAMTAREMGDLDRAVALGRTSALRHGDPFDARLALEIMLLLKDVDPACAFAAEFAAAHPGQAGAIADLANAAAEDRALWTGAAARHGEASFADRARLRQALTANSDADMILWGKGSLVALLRSGAMTAEDFAVFGTYLPNWENGEIKSYVLFHALRQRPDDAPIRERWLRRLLSDRCFGDAALWLAGALPAGPTDDLVAYAIVLLRLRQVGLLPDAPAAEAVDLLEPVLRDSLPTAGWALRATMFEHLRSLGLEAGAWFPPGDPPPDHRAFRRLMGASTGRLNLSQASLAQIKSAAPRPVIVISGQLRGFASAWPALHRHVVAPTGAPVVMTVWDRTTNAVGRHARRLERMLPGDIVAALRPEQRFTDVFAQAFPRTSSLILGEWEVSVKELDAILAAHGVTPLVLETESDSMLMRLLRPHLTNGMIRMYYKFARAERLVRESEIRLGTAFSHVIWSRPDFEIVRLSAGAIARCLGRDDVAFSSWTTETSVGDYFMVLPRLAFAAIASVFSRVVIGGDTMMLPWRPQHETPMSDEQLLSVFGGPETIFEILLAAGIVPLGRVEFIDGRLVGRTPPEALLRQTFFAEAGHAER